MTKSTLIERTRTAAARCLWRLVRLCPAVRELEADNDRIRKDFGDMSANRVTLYDIAVRNGCLTAEGGTEAAWLIAEKFGMLLRERGAENYLEMQFHSPKVPGETLCLTLKWEAGKTPHEKRVEAERERDELKARLSLANVIDQPRPWLAQSVRQHDL